MGVFILKLQVPQPKRKKKKPVQERSVYLVVKASGPAAGPGRERSGRCSMWRGQRLQWLGGQATPCPRVHRGAGQVRSTCRQRKDRARTGEGRTHSASAQTPVLRPRGEKKGPFYGRSISHTAL